MKYTGSASSAMLRLGTQLYRTNPFRLTGLPVTASVRDFRRYLEEVKLQEKFGAAADSSGEMLPINPHPDFDTMRDAVQALQKDPETRLIHEFFWLWPLSAEAGITDSAFALLKNDDVEAAAKFYKNLMAKGVPHGSIAQHNLAVLLHLQALDLEWQAEQQSLQQWQQSVRDRSWEDVLYTWKGVQTDHGVWHWLEARVRAINDPRLTVEAVKRLRELLPFFLCLSSAKLAVRSAQRGFTEKAATHVAHLTLVSGEVALHDQALRTAIESTIEQIASTWQRLESEAERDVDKGAEIAKELLDQTRPLIAIVDTVLPTGHPFREDTHDQVALTGLCMLIAYGNKTERWAVCFDLVEQCLALAMSESSRARIQTNRDTIRANKERETCWFCEKGKTEDSIGHKVKIHRNVRREGNQVQWDTRDVAVPRCKKCEKTHNLHSNLLGLLFLIVTVGIIGGIAAAVELERRGWGSATSLIWCPIFGILLLVILGIFFLKKVLHGIRSINSAKDSPQVQALLTEGWQLGERPPGV